MQWRHGRKATPKRPWSAPPVTPPGRPQRAGTRFLSRDERGWIAARVHSGAGVRRIAAELGRAPSTVSRELHRNRDPDRGDYHPATAEDRALARRPRPKPGKIAANPRLRAVIEQQLRSRWSPEQISARLRRQFPRQQEMQVAHETIYRSLYVQGRGQLRRELARALRTGRAQRRPQHPQQQRPGRFAHDMVMISQRPAEAADRAVPGHWEGDVILGARNASAIGTLVERSTRFVTLLRLPHGRDAEAFHRALADAVSDLPAHLTRSLTWDQGSEMARHHQFTLATGIPIYFCDPASPWQRGSNENTNRLLRQYFPKGTDLSAHTQHHLNAVAAELNARPRKTLGWDTPAEQLTTLINTN